MKIYSWNICDVNKNFNKAFEYIKGLDFDVLCLQEVPEHLLKKLKKLPYNIEYHMDLKRHKKGKWETIYLVIITPHKITDSGKFYTGRDWQEPLRTKIFRNFMRVAGWTKNDAYGALCVDIQKGKKKYRVFSLHLHVGKPLLQIKQLQNSFEYLNTKIPNIICGDFNTVNLWYIKPFRWLLGASFKEASPKFKGHILLQKLYKKYGFSNPLHGKKTHTLFNSQLDHILVPENCEVRSSQVEKNSIGSDHYPISVEIT